jgi:hypothetical protein
MSVCLLVASIKLEIDRLRRSAGGVQLNGGGSAQIRHLGLSANHASSLL